MLEHLAVTQRAPRREPRPQRAERQLHLRRLTPADGVIHRPRHICVAAVVDGGAKLGGAVTVERVVQRRAKHGVARQERERLRRRRVDDAVVRRREEYHRAEATEALGVVGAAAAGHLVVERCEPRRLVVGADALAVLDKVGHRQLRLAALTHPLHVVLVLVAQQPRRQPVVVGGRDRDAGVRRVERHQDARRPAVAPRRRAHLHEGARQDAALRVAEEREAVLERRRAAHPLHERLDLRLQRRPNVARRRPHPFSRAARAADLAAAAADARVARLGGGEVAEVPAEDARAGHRRAHHLPEVFHRWARAEAGHAGHDHHRQRRRRRRRRRPRRRRRLRSDELGGGRGGGRGVRENAMLGAGARRRIRLLKGQARRPRSHGAGALVEQREPRRAASGRCSAGAAAARRRVRP